MITILTLKKQVVTTLYEYIIFFYILLLYPLDCLEMIVQYVPLLPFCGFSKITFLILLGWTVQLQLVEKMNAI